MGEKIKSIHLLILPLIIIFFKFKKKKFKPINLFILKLKRVQIDLFITKLKMIHKLNKNDINSTLILFYLYSIDKPHHRTN